MVWVQVMTAHRAWGGGACITGICVGHGAPRACITYNPPCITVICVGHALGAGPGEWGGVRARTRVRFRDMFPDGENVATPVSGHDSAWQWTRLHEGFYEGFDGENAATPAPPPTPDCYGNITVMARMPLYPYTVI